jgi:photosystem II stability/assembly factor-like uncharacterized protein
MTSDQGATWDITNAMDVPDPAIVHAIAFSDELHGILLVEVQGSAGDIDTILLGTSDAGRTWSPVPLSE